MKQRPIKFRAWDKANAIMLIPQSTIMVDSFDGAVYDVKMDEYRPDLVLMQFTGLHDKNGKEIWEGDVVRFHLGRNDMSYARVNGEVVYKRFGYHVHVSLETLNQYHVPSYHERMSLLLGMKDDDSKHSTVYEVIGNIYENPELLKS